MSSRERLRAALKEPSSPLHAISLSSLLLSPSPPPPRLSTPHTTFLLQRCTAISPTTTRTFLQRLSRDARFFYPLIFNPSPFPPPPPPGEPLRNRREPALISHLPLFFISDIRIYHRDPAGTPLERAEGGGGGGRNESRGERSDTG